MRPGRFHPGNARPGSPTSASSASGFNEAGAFPPRKWAMAFSAPLVGLGFNEAGAFPPRKSPRPTARSPSCCSWSVWASMRPGRFHPGNSPCGTPCATWAFHPFCERWLLCRPGQANSSPNAHHNTTYLLVIQHRKHPARATGPFSSTGALAGTRQTCSEKAECLAKQWSPAGSAPYRSCPDFRPEDRLGPPAPSPRLGCDPPPT